MKKTFILIVCLMATIASLTAQEWTTDFEASKKSARQTNKNILLVFKGSDWCAPCIKLDKEIFQSNYFKENYAQNFVLLEADFPRKKKNRLPKEQQNHNNSLAALFNPNGHFPLVVVLNSDGKVLGKKGYEKTTPVDYLNSLIAIRNSK